MRIVQLLAPARAGGLESVVHQLSTGLLARGHEVVVAAVLPPGQSTAHPVVEALKEAGVRTEVMAVGTREYRRERAAVRALLLATKAQILHTHGYRPDVIDGGVARQAGAAHVTTLHGFTAQSWKGHLYEWLQVRAAVRADAAIAVSKPIQQRLEGAGGSAVAHLLQNAVTPHPHPLNRRAAREALGLPVDATLIGWVGRLSAEKGPDLFLDAFVQLRDAQANTSQRPVHGVFVGDGPLRSTLEARQVADVHFTGMVQGASRFLAAFDALALTSRTEGTPMILLEAMWAGLPILATRVGGVPGVVDEQCALLPAPMVHSIADALQILVADPSASQSRAAMARVRVAERHDPVRWIATHEEIYTSVVRSGQAVTRSHA